MLNVWQRAVLGSDFVAVELRFPQLVGLWHFSVRFWFVFLHILGLLSVRSFPGVDQSRINTSLI